ncbi:TPA: hypothetical protein ACFP41_000707 [Neisseria weaveri]
MAEPDVGRILVSDNLPKLPATSRNFPQCRIQESDLHHSYLRPSEKQRIKLPNCLYLFRRHRVGRILVSDNPPKFRATPHNVGFKNPTYIIRI